MNSEKNFISKKPFDSADLSRWMKTVLAGALTAVLLLSGCAGKNTQNTSSGDNNKDTQNITSDVEDKDSSSPESEGNADADKDNSGESSELADPEEMPLEAVFFDVGKGDCILFTSGDRHVLLDTGYEKTADEIIRELQKRNVDSLDAMIITHYDKDHVGGAAEIASVIPPDMIYLPNYDGKIEKCGDLIKLIDAKDLPHVRVTSPEEFIVGSADFKVNPALVDYDLSLENEDDVSLIIEVHCGDDDWLLPGDIAEEASDIWISSNNREYDILKYPHHGKKEKNLKEFISNVSPEIAVITDSEEKEAAKKVLKELDEQEIDVYRSSQNGTITITGNGTEEFDVSTEK